MSRYAFDDKNHVHTLDGKPLTGCSSVMDVLSKPLTWWASGEAVKSLGWTHGKPRVNGKYVPVPLEDRISAAKPIHDAIKAETTEAYIARLDKAYKAHSVKLDKAADKGTDLHAELEKFVKDCMHHKPETIIKESYPSQIWPFVEWSQDNVKNFLWSEGHCYSEVMWTGGISDAGAELVDGSFAVIDFKSAKAGYTSSFLQDAGYALMVEENGIFSEKGTHCKKFEGVRFNKFIVVPFGTVPVVPDVRPRPEYPVDVSLFEQGFQHALALYRLIGLGER